VAELTDIRTALVVGLGRSGRAAAEALADAGVRVIVVDDRVDADGSGLPDGVQVQPGASGEDRLAEVDLVVPSPGVPEHAPVVQSALALGLPVWSEPELAWRIAPRRLVAITGTNGKTTTTELVTAMLQASGIVAVSCGNIGTPLVTAATQAPADALLVVELSSFQLRFCERLRPDVGVLLNVADDHLDWHGSATEYAAAKARLWQAQGDRDWAVANADDPAALALLATAPGRVATFSGTRLPGTGDNGPSCGLGVAVGARDGRLVSTIPGGKGTVLDLAGLLLQAPHHLANIAAAAAVAILAGADHAAIAAAAAAYRPGRHRLEVVASAHAITWVDDSKATNPHAAAAALDGTRSTVWIAGGLAKGVDLDVLADHLERVRTAVLIGEAADALAVLCDRHGVPVHRSPSIEDAVATAARLARPGDTVLLSPACASFDQFRDYAERGDRFAEAARAVASTAGADGSAGPARAAVDGGAP